MNRTPPNPPMAVVPSTARDYVYVPIPAPARPRQRLARLCDPGEKRSRHHLPERLESSSPLGYRTRVSLAPEEARLALALPSRAEARRFMDTATPYRTLESTLFEEAALGVLVSRQSTNFFGQRQVTLGPSWSGKVEALLDALEGREGAVLRGAAHTHLWLGRPYQTPFTALLTFVGHPPLADVLTVPFRALRKGVAGHADIPSIGWLPHVHAGILSEQVSRAVALAHAGRMGVRTFLRPFVGEAAQRNAPLLSDLEKAAGLNVLDTRLGGWRLMGVTQVGVLPPGDRLPFADLDDALPNGRSRMARRIAATAMAFRSERVLPGHLLGVELPENVPWIYREPEETTVPQALMDEVLRAARDAFEERLGYGVPEGVRDALLVHEIDTTSAPGQTEITLIRQELDEVTQRIRKNLPVWADAVSLGALARLVEQGTKAFALSGQRVVIFGLDGELLRGTGVDFEHAVRAVGAAIARACWIFEIAGSTEIPEGADLLGGVCAMAGPVNLNDIGKSFYGHADLLRRNYGQGLPTSLAVVCFKAKTPADPIGNEEQLLNRTKRGPLVDLRKGPHEAVALRASPESRVVPMRADPVSRERAFHDVGNFVAGPDGREIEGNRGVPYPPDRALRRAF